MLPADGGPHRGDEQHAEAVFFAAAGGAQDGAAADPIAAQRFLEGVPARTGRGHVETQRQVGDVKLNADKAVGRRKFDGVGEQIENDLGYSLGVDGEFNIGRE